MFDLDRAAGKAFQVTFASGEERWADLGASEAVHPAPGEVVFLDEAGTVHARRWCWRQSAESAARDATTKVLITVEGPHAGAPGDVCRARDDLLELLHMFVSPTSVRSGIVNAQAARMRASTAVPGPVRIR